MLQKARDVYMDYLKQEHVTGIPEFIRTLIKRKSTGGQGEKISS